MFKQFKSPLIIFLCITILLSSCVTSNNLRQNLEIETLHVYVNYDEYFDEKYIDRSYDQILASIQRFNSDEKDFDIKIVNTVEESDLVVHMQAFEHATRSTQTTCFIASMLGVFGMPALLIYTGSPIIIFFYFTPGDKTYISIKPDNEIQSIPKTIPAPFRTFTGYFTKEEKHINKHFIKLEEHFYKYWYYFEKEYRRKK